MKERFEELKAALETEVVLRFPRYYLVGIGILGGLLILAALD